MFSNMAQTEQRAEEKSSCFKKKEGDDNSDESMDEMDKLLLENQEDSKKIQEQLQDMYSTLHQNDGNNDDEHMSSFLQKFQQFNKTRQTSFK